MILFKPEHVEPILRGQKTQTRRIGKRRWKVGSIHQAKLNYKPEFFASLQIKNIREEKLGDILEQDATAEGYKDATEYKDAFKRIYGYWDDDLVVWVVEFQKVQ